MNKHYKSSFTDEQELLRAICDVHIGKREFDIDPMYNKGKFYKDGTISVIYKGDIAPLTWDVGEMDAGNIGCIDDSFDSMILDPPFMFRKMKKSKSLIADRYTMYETYKELKESYESIIKEASRVLRKKGILVFKCQDFTNSKTTMTHVLVYNLLEKFGFYIKDLAILVKENKIYNPNTVQRHLRKTHTYFWVAVKR